MPNRFFAFTALASAVTLSATLTAPVSASAQGSALAGASLASSLVQSRAQLRILKADDKVDLACETRTFTEAQVITEPAVKTVSATVSERKWQEQWTLDRCGQPVGYRVFFTEVGDGGAYFSFVRTE